jgi:hypothetical protein
VAARRNLRRLLADDVLPSYVQLAESGALRKREVLVDGERLRPPTAAATNAARLGCLGLLRQAVDLPPLDLAPAEPVELRPTPEPDRLVALRRRLGDDLGRSLSDGQVRFTAVVSMVLDTGARSGELVDQHLAHLSEDHSCVSLVRRPQHSTADEPDGETLPLSALSRAALERWLPIRAYLVAGLQGSATALWVSLFRNHAGVLDDYGNATERPAGMPLQERGLIRSYNDGRRRYGFTDLLGAIWRLGASAGRAAFGRSRPDASARRPPSQRTRDNAAARRRSIPQLGSWSERPPARRSQATPIFTGCRCRLIFGPWPCDLTSSTTTRLPLRMVSVGSRWHG